MCGAALLLCSVRGASALKDHIWDIIERVSLLLCCVIYLRDASVLKEHILGEGVPTCVLYEGSTL